MTSRLVCVDANFVVGLLSGGTIAVPFIYLWDQWQNAAYTPVAPALIYYEVSNAFHRLSLAGQLLPEQAEQSLNAALNLNITLYGDAELHREAFTLARSLRLSATYDSHYLALAQRLGCEFWTADRRLYNSVQASLPWIHLVGVA
ncbi:type II toxin-antitoxin system VapC family toxin [Hassallia byssoidea VB512170]|uniref:Type II toxin-antitoxin system VapC family toxin n=1 Tax=Hassallia byssoidea VB512170 TaxID=1304833 RepID=A0A846HLB2_9CYAN|nr:type II toxin-antitoxin system VapC family toxin [Hassalia byssoidea]NEU77060.1 type II toxin-antitoxin system VapC family toxin [Hassalia byssoidea VB512170]